MFSLIITIVSIALVVALVAATMYYGGDTLSQGRDRADAAAYVSGGQQISSAIQLHKALDGSGLDNDLSKLTEGGKYLTSLPTVKGEGTWAVTGTDGAAGEDRVVTIGSVPNDVCKAINFQAGTAEADAAIPTELASGSTFGCHGTDGANTFTYKY